MQVRTGDNALPVVGAVVTLTNLAGEVLFATTTNDNGNTSELALSAPNWELTLQPDYRRPAYATYNVNVIAKGYVTMHIQNVEIVDTQTSILPVNMLPLLEERNPETEMDVDIPPVGLLLAEQNLQISSPIGRILRDVIIPEYITVHLGVPENTSARNVRVHFIEYIKNVVSSEIYSTWPYSSLVANTHVIVTFALNRVYTEWYRSRGYNFDITNSTSVDQYFREGGPIFENISLIVDDIFNIYAHRFAFQNPFFTQFCNGTTSTCPGLSQWGTVTLAGQGRTPLEILRYYYPDDLVLTASEKIAGIIESFPGELLYVGSQGNDVRRMQNYLNRIRGTYQLIPLISNPIGLFDVETRNAVMVFQRTFNLIVDGIIGRNTWNRIIMIYVAVTRLAELNSEGERISIGRNPPNVVLSLGSRGEDVLELQFILNFSSPYFATLPPVIEDGNFDLAVRNAVIEFQKTFGLTPDGIVGPATWDKLYAVYRGINQNVTIPTLES